MKLLSIETATTAGAVALVIDGSVFGEATVTEDRRHTETVIPSTMDLLSRAGFRPQELGGIVIDIGPGLFTGLRVGIATARSLAFAAGRPLYPLSSLEILANDPVVEDAANLICIIDGRRGEVFVQRFERRGTAVVTKDEPRVLRPAEVAEELKNSTELMTLLGDGVARYREMFSELENVVLRDVVVPSPGIAAQMVERGLVQEVGNPALVLPLYLRDPDAVANFTVAASYREP